MAVIWSHRSYFRGLQGYGRRPVDAPPEVVDAYCRTLAACMERADIRDRFRRYRTHAAARPTPHEGDRQDSTRH